MKIKILVFVGAVIDITMLHLVPLLAFGPAETRWATDSTRRPSGRKSDAGAVR